jgi:hypothetical protein
VRELLDLAWNGAGRFLPAFSSRFSSTLLSFLVLLAASHFLPTSEYGLYVFLFSIGSALGLIAVLGQQILVVKHYRRAEASGHPLNQALLGVNARWLALGCFVLLAAALPLWLFAERLPPTYHYLWLAFVFAAIFALSEYLQNYFRIHGRINMSLVPARDRLARQLDPADRRRRARRRPGRRRGRDGDHYRPARGDNPLSEHLLRPGRGAGLAPGARPGAAGDPWRMAPGKAAISSPTTC